jgi:hypothetical protein
MKPCLATKLFFFTAIFSLVYSVLTKLFMYNKDILRQKNSDLQLTPSQLYIGIAIAFFIMALVYYLFDKSSRFYIKNKLKLIQYFLITPLILILFVANFLETYYPETGSSNIGGWIFGIITVFATFAFIPGFIMFFVNIVIGLNTKKP